MNSPNGLVRERARGAVDPLTAFGARCETSLVNPVVFWSCLPLVRGPVGCLRRLRSCELAGAEIRAVHVDATEGELSFGSLLAVEVRSGISGI